jgi:hypothetical protein
LTRVDGPLATTELPVKDGAAANAGNAVVRHNANAQNVDREQVCCQLLRANILIPMTSGFYAVISYHEQKDGFNRHGRRFLGVAIVTGCESYIR